MSLLLQHSCFPPDIWCLRGTSVQSSWPASAVWQTHIEQCRYGHVRGRCTFWPMGYMFPTWWIPWLSQMWTSMQACYVWWLHEVCKGLIHHQQSQRMGQKRLWGHILCLYSLHAMTKPIEWGDFTSAGIYFFCWYFPSSSTSTSSRLKNIWKNIKYYLGGLTPHPHREIWGLLGTRV